MDSAAAASAAAISSLKSLPHFWHTTLPGLL
jgi:hypothetical protein